MGIQIVSDNYLLDITNQAKSDGYKEGYERGYSSCKKTEELYKGMEESVKVHSFQEQVCIIFSINPSDLPIRLSDSLDTCLEVAKMLINSERQKIKELEESWEGLSRLESVIEYKQQKTIIVSLNKRIEELTNKLQMIEQQNTFLTNQNKGFSTLIVELQNTADRANIQGNNPVK